MIIEESFTIAAPRDQVAAFLVDADRVGRCVPGVDGIQATGDGTYAATLQAQVGPVAASFQGSLRVDDSAAPERLVAVGDGRDRRSGSQAKVEFVADLEEQGEHTLVRARADVVIRGRLGQFGTGVISATAREMVREFAACLDATLAAATTQPVGAAPPPRPASLSRVAGRGLLAWIGDLLARARGLIRRLLRTRGR